MWVDDLKNSDKQPPENKGRGGLDTPLTPYTETPIQLFIHNQKMLKQSTQVLKLLGFKHIRIIQVIPNYFQAMRQLFTALGKNEGLTLVNNPPAKGPDGLQSTYQDLSLGDFFKGVATFFAEEGEEAASHLNRCLPVFIGPSDPAAREELIRELLPHGLMAAFMLHPQAPGVPNDVEIEERTQEFFDYFLDYFRQRDNEIAQFKEYKSAAELKDRKAEAEELMARVRQLKTGRDYEEAIALCRQAIGVLPSDPEAYLEGGRILMRKRRFSSAMQMFRDAEAVAEAAPAPNQEIGNLRVEQVKEHLRQAGSQGQEVDRAAVDQYLSEAAKNFEAAIKKADAIVSLDAEAREAKRKKAVVGITGNLLSLGLSGAVAEDNPHIRQLMDMAQERIERPDGVAEELGPEQLVQLGLHALAQGDIERAEEELFRAAQHKQAFELACSKINFLATQLRKRGDFDHAIEVYDRLLELEPLYKGYVLLNLATAFMSKSLNLAASDPEEAQLLEQDAFGVAVEALYLEPDLPAHANFYYNSLIAPLFGRGIKAFALAAKRAAVPEGDDAAREAETRVACHRARQTLEALFSRGQQGEAIKLLFSLARELPAFFLQFDRHVSQPVLEFTGQIYAALNRMENPRLAKLGKVCGILLQKGEQAMAPLPPANDPMVNQIIDDLNQRLPSLAARDLAWILYGSPRTIMQPAFWQNQPLMDLCLDLHYLVSQVDVRRFSAPPQNPQGAA